MEGVFELYTDVTPLIADINKTTTNVVLYLLVSLGLLYWALYLIVRRADHIMGRQVADLKQANKRAISSNKAKSEFLANMSHELRTPLNSIMILSKMLSNNKDKNLTPRQSESATIIHNSGRNLLTLIDTILDLSKVEAGKIELTIADLEIKEEVYHLLKQFEPMAQEKGLTLAINIDKKVANTFRTDSQRFLQILKNLFSNAITFTSSGSVTLNIEHPDKVVLQGLKLPYEQIITFSVVDTGIGIPEEKRKSVFDAFKQADGSINRQYGGTGLGLKISRELATLLGGELHLSKSSNAGSTFTLYLPVDKGLTQEPIEAGYKFNETAIDQSKSNPPQITDPDNWYQNIPNYQDEIEPGDRTILIIEDDGNFAKILQNLAHEEGYKTIVTNMGFSGLILARSLKPSAIYLDLGLPDIDGLSVLNQLKSDPQTNHIPIQVVSGREDDDQAIDRGAVGFLRKPVSSENLGKMFACFDNHFKGVTNDEEMLGADEYNQTNIKNSAHQSSKTTLERHSDKKIFENKKVLLVDDNMANVSALSLILKDAGLKVETADNGQLALDKLAKVNDINIVLMDIMMPVMDGLEAIRKIRIQPEFLSLPVIALTAKAMRRDCEDCINAGANDYLSKPIDTDKLLYLMRMRLSKRPAI